MSRLLVATEDPAGGDRVYLDTVGAVSGVRTRTSENGDLEATWQLTLDPKTDHRALQPGRRVLIPSGSTPWRGVLHNPERGEVWSLTATGWPALANNYTAIASTTGNALKLDEVVDEAIARGLPWTRTASLPSLAAGQQSSGFGTVADALAQVCDAKAQLWRVDRSGVISAGARPTNLAYILQANDTAGGRTVGDYVTDVHVTYQDSTDYGVKTVTRSAATRPYGRFEQPLDVTARGPITTAHAQEIGDSWLTKRGARLQFRSPFTVSAGQLLTVGGTPVDLATVTAADGLVRIMLTDPDTAAGELSYASPSIAIAETDYDADADVLTLTPLDRSTTGFVFA